MNRTSSLLFPAALGFSAAAHLLALFLLPYSPARPAGRQAEPIPVRLLEAPRLASPPPARPPAAMKAQPERPEPAKHQAVPEPEPVAPQPTQPPKPEARPEPEAPRAPLELAPPQPAAVGTTVTGSEESSSPAVADRALEGGAAALAAEVAATHAVLSNLRERIVKKIRYPPLARANGWKGTTLLEVLLDEGGRLRGLAVRRSSGYAVLDRAAESLLKAVTPVDNPLRRPLRIEVPIVYELTD